MLFQSIITMTRGENEIERSEEVETRGSGLSPNGTEEIEVCKRSSLGRVDKGHNFGLADEGQAQRRGGGRGDETIPRH